jgi:hypothetical protein
MIYAPAGVAKNSAKKITTATKNQPIMRLLKNACSFTLTPGASRGE